jgi:hypothetical protein
MRYSYTSKVHLHPGGTFTVCTPTRHVHMGTASPSRFNHIYEVLHLRFVCPDVLSRRTFCPHGRFVRRTFCLTYVRSPDVFLPDVLSLRTFCRRTFCLGTTTTPLHLRVTSLTMRYIYCTHRKCSSTLLKLQI